MLCHYCFKLNIVILTFVLLLSGCGTSNPNAAQTNLDEENTVQQDSSEIIAESEPTSTPEPTDNPTPNNIITETPGATEPGVAQIPRLNYYWPTVFPRDLVVDPTQSSLTTEGYQLELNNPTDGQWWATIRGGATVQPPPIQGDPQTIRGYDGQAGTTGAGYSIYWDEGDYQYVISSSLGLEEALTLAENLEPVSVEIWEDRLTNNASAPNPAPPAGATEPGVAQIPRLNCQGRCTFDPHRQWKLTHPGMIRMGWTDSPQAVGDASGNCGH